MSQSVRLCNIEPLELPVRSGQGVDYRACEAVRQYKLVEPFPSPLSHPRHATQSQLEAQQKRMEEMQKRLEALEAVQTERLVLADNVRRRQRRTKR